MARLPVLTPLTQLVSCLRSPLHKCDVILSDVWRVFAPNGVEGSAVASCFVCHKPTGHDASSAFPSHNVGESSPSIASRTILIGGNPCLRKSSWNFSRLNAAPSFFFTSSRSFMISSLPRV